MENNLLTQGVKRNLPRDVVLHLFAMVTLYWSAITFITLCWQYVDYFFPDLLNYGYNNAGSIRFAVSSLVIVFPLYMLSSWILGKIYRQEPVVRDSKTRKWLIYLTLFIAALIIIGDLIFVINAFLGGAVAASFILKALSILVVAAVIFGYYLDDVRRSVASDLAKYVAWITSAIVLAAIVGAFFIVGTPMQARLAQFDQQRITDLQGIQLQVVNYWQAKGMLPQNLSDLNNSISGYTVPEDPQTKTSYEYTVTNATAVTFQLCATFDVNSNQENTINPGGPMIPASVDGISQNWDHAAGRVCFDRTIDRQLYPPTVQK